MDVEQIEQRRLKVLDVLATLHPLAIFTELSVDESLAFKLSQNALSAIRKGLSHAKRRQNESLALGTVTVAAQTPDYQQTLYEMNQFKFEHVGGRDMVYTERHTLKTGEIEIHTHIPMTPDYLGNTDVGDLIAAIEGPAWVHPTTKLMQAHLRIFAILSVYPNRLAQLDFYSHNLLGALSASHNYGLRRAGYPIIIPDAY
ncbi:MAG: hypothetical protein AAF846_00930 [Chloroflexota bacterium]